MHMQSVQNTLNLNVVYDFPVMIVEVFGDDHSREIDENDWKECFF